MIVTRLVDFYILPLVLNGAAGRIIKAHEQFYKGSFSRSVVAYNCNMFTRLYSQADVIQYRAGFFVVLKAYVV